MNSELIHINFSASNIVMMQLCLVQAVAKQDESFFSRYL